MIDLYHILSMHLNVCIRIFVAILLLNYGTYLALAKDNNKSADIPVEEIKRILIAKNHKEIEAMYINANPGKFLVSLYQATYYLKAEDKATALQTLLTIDAIWTPPIIKNDIFDAKKDSYYMGISSLLCELNQIQPIEYTYESIQDKNVRIKAIDQLNQVISAAKEHKLKR